MTFVSDNDFEKTLKFRKEFGLNPDFSTNKSNNIIKSEKYGVLLTKEEEEQLTKRFQKQDEKVPVIKDYLAANSLDGIIYIDQEKSGIINIGLKDANQISQYQNKIKEIYGDDSKIHFFSTKYSEKELDQLHEKIWELSKKIEDQPIMGVSTDVTNQNVKVYLKDLNSEVKVTLNQLFPSSPIEYLLWENNGGDEARDSKLRPLQAGINLTNAYQNNNPCTIGFQANQSLKKL